MHDPSVERYLRTHMAGIVPPASGGAATGVVTPGYGAAEDRLAATQPRHPTVGEGFRPLPVEWMNHGGSRVHPGAPGAKPTYNYEDLAYNHQQGGYLPTSGQQPDVEMADWSVVPYAQAYEQLTGQDMTPARELGTSRQPYEAHATPSRLATPLSEEQMRQAIPAYLAVGDQCLDSMARETLRGRDLRGLSGETIRYLYGRVLRAAGECLGGDPSAGPGRGPR